MCGFYYRIYGVGRQVYGFAVSDCVTMLSVTYYRSPINTPYYRLAMRHLQRTDGTVHGSIVWDVANVDTHDRPRIK